MAAGAAVTVWIAQPGARSDEAVEKLTELGVARIGALRTELLKGAFTDGRIERWSRVAEAAAKQSKQARVPEILASAVFADVLSPEAVVLSHEGASGGLADRIVGRRQATLLIGPEPGFSEERAGAGPGARRGGGDVRTGGAAHRDRRDRRRSAGAARDGLPGMSRFATEFLGCKVALADAQAVRERLAADGHAESSADGRMRVVNTCCVTAEAVAKSRKAVRRAARDRRARVRDRLRGQPRRRRRRRRRRQRDGPSRPAPSRARGRVAALGALGCAGGAAPRLRAHPRLRQGAGRLLVRLQLLRHPRRARPEPQPGRGSCAGRGAPPRARRATASSC